MPEEFNLQRGLKSRRFSNDIDEYHDLASRGGGYPEDDWGGTHHTAGGITPFVSALIARLLPAGLYLARRWKREASRMYYETINDGQPIRTNVASPAPENTKRPGKAYSHFRQPGLEGDLRPIEHSKPLAVFPPRRWL